MCNLESQVFTVEESWLLPYVKAVIIKSRYQKHQSELQTHTQICLLGIVFGIEGSKLLIHWQNSKEVRAYMFVFPGLKICVNRLKKLLYVIFNLSHQ